MFDYNKFKITISSLGRLLRHKIVVVSILSVIGYLILYLLDINILNYIHWDSDDEYEGSNTEDESLGQNKIKGKDVMNVTQTEGDKAKVTLTVDKEVLEQGVKIVGKALTDGLPNAGIGFAAGDIGQTVVQVSSGPPVGH